MENGKQYMNKALELAVKGCGHVNPNPMVGAVIVKNGKIIGQGYHAAYGDLHAERAALASCTESPQGADMYVTLEPCCHYGKQPPCTEAIIESGIKHVIIGSNDPNKLVAGKGIDLLRSANIRVTTNFMKEECDEINNVFFHYITTGLPYVVMKYAMTMDGKIATRTGASKWITGEKARQNVHQDRNRYSGIMVGIETVLADDPMLNCRLPRGKNPKRIICDTRLRIPLDSQIVKTAEKYETIIACSCDYQDKAQALTESGCTVLNIPDKNGHVDLNLLMQALGKMKIDSILLEGGGRLNWSALESKIVSRIQAYIAPKLFGGEAALSPIRGLGADIPANAIQLKSPKISVLGDDILIESEVCKCSQA